MNKEISLAISGQNITKNFKGFNLNIPKLEIPKGFATALIGENGAGKTTLMNILSGIRLDFKGNLNYFDKWNSIEAGTAKEDIGYTGTTNYFLPNWNGKQISDISEILFDNFNKGKFWRICNDMNLTNNNFSKKVSELSDGNRMKLILATVLARDTKMLILDEPASPLDPLMRDNLCEIIRDYLDNGDGENTVFFSTHNIMDMENVTDYAIIMENGSIAEEGFVEDLKEKYILVKGDTEGTDEIMKHLYTSNISKYGIEGICLAQNVDKLAGLNVTLERPTLFQISVAVMKKNSQIKIGR